VKLMMLQSFLPGQSKGGVGYQVAGLASALTRKGHDVTVLSFAAAPPRVDFQVTCPRVGRPVFASRAGRLLLGPLAFAAHSYGAFDVVHAHGDNQFLYRRTIPVVRTFYGSALEEARHAERARRRISQRALFLCERVGRRTATLTVGISENTQGSLGRLDAIIPCGVDRKLFRPGAKSHHPSLLFVGTMSGRKRGHLIVEAFRTVIRGALPDCELWLVSDRPETGRGIRNFDRPSDEQLADLYRQAWILVHPSNYEGFGVPYIEAMASGTAIVSTENAGARELLGDERCGTLVPDADLGVAILEILNDVPRRKGMEQHGREFSGRFDWEDVAGQYEAIYEAALHRVSRAGR